MKILYTIFNIICTYLSYDDEENIIIDESAWL